MTLEKLTKELTAKKELKIRLRRELEPHILTKFDKLLKLEKEISDLVAQINRAR